MFFLQKERTCEKGLSEIFSIQQRQLQREVVKLGKLNLQKMVNRKQKQWIIWSGIGVRPATIGVPVMVLPTIRRKKSVRHTSKPEANVAEFGLYAAWGNVCEARGDWIGNFLSIRDNSTEGYHTSVFSPFYNMILLWALFSPYAWYLSLVAMYTALFPTKLHVVIGTDHGIPLTPLIFNSTRSTYAFSPIFNLPLVQYRIFLVVLGQASVKSLSVRGTVVSYACIVLRFLVSVVPVLRLLGPIFSRRECVPIVNKVRHETVGTSTGLQHVNWLYWQVFYIIRVWLSLLPGQHPTQSIFIWINIKPLLNLVRSGSYPPVYLFSNGHYRRVSTLLHNE